MVMCRMLQVVYTEMGQKAIICGDTVWLELNNGWTKFNTCHFDTVGSRFWHIDSSGYAVSAKGKDRPFVLMHKIVCDHTEFVDHANRVRNDNMDSNLRPANRSENNRNCGRRKDNTTGFKGVSWHRSVGKFTSRIWKNGKRVHLGVFDTAQDASAAYKAAAKDEYGAFFSEGEVLKEESW